MAKTANLLVDGLGRPERIGLLLPLHWQTVVLVLAGAAVGAEVTLAAAPDELVGCAACFVLPDAAEAALDAGVDEVLVLSGHPMGIPVSTPLPALVLDYAREVPSYGDHFGGPRPGPARISCAGHPVTPVSGIDAGDRVQTSADLRGPEGAGVLLGALVAGASLVLVPDGAAGLELTAERVTQVLP